MTRTHLISTATVALLAAQNAVRQIALTDPDPQACATADAVLACLYEASRLTGRLATDTNPLAGRSAGTAPPPAAVTPPAPRPARLMAACPKYDPKDIGCNIDGTCSIVGCSTVPKFAAVRRMKMKPNDLPAQPHEGISPTGDSAPTRERGRAKLLTGRKRTC